ncbi:MAG: anhydro-N-acetylmuramic acid kinase AnmK [Turicibacter sp.]|nr:anhydro-N-acetylmuramic acid kinase AnmK [Turicibacter sp.]
MKYAVGLMSGTSLDGVDAALVEITGSGTDTKVKVIDFMTTPFTQAERDKIGLSLAPDTSNVAQICSLNFELGYQFAAAVKQLCAKNDLALSELSFIGSHGQTIYHQPVAAGDDVASTLQIGEPAVIAYETNTLVVSNFRTMDVAAGGQGAPLVPYTEWILYRDSAKSRLLQNIGGIGNVTVMPAGAELADVFAFDTGPGNMIIDALCERLFQRSYDEGGELAAKGCVNETLLAECMAMPYVTTPPPKTTGRELFGGQFVDKLIAQHSEMDKCDLLATMTMFTAKTMALNYELFIFPRYDIDEVIIGGGGSYNKALVGMLRELLVGKCEVFVGEDIGHSSEAKEAVAFAVLANETINRNASNVPRATGANEAVVLGNVTYPPRQKVRGADQ